MAHYIFLFSPETYEAFSRSSKDVSGVRLRQEGLASRVQPGDKLICYMTKLGRWVGILEVASPYFKDSTPVFYSENDPFVIRFKVRPTVWLPKEKAVPIKEERVWNTLTFTQSAEKNSSTWTGKLRNSLNLLEESDGRFLEELLLSQGDGGMIFPVEEREYKKFLGHTVHREDKVVAVSVPEDNGADEESEIGPSVRAEVRESIQIQALLAQIGSEMGMKIWIPRSDKTAVLSEWTGDHSTVLVRLPLNYDETTLRTVEQIDILWLKGRAIVRAFEVEHTTSIYSGILRMADLLALQPNMDIKLHIVAPESRRDKVFQEIRRPVFSLLERGPLSESCTYLSYDDIRELAQERNLSYMKDNVIEQYADSGE